jgi:general secretion pathway protein K
MIGTERNQRGFALLVVLWTVALLALLGTYLVVAARDRMAMARDLRTASALEFATDGATQHAIFELLNGHWTPDGTVRALRIGPGIVSILLEDEADKINPNFASTVELQALMQLVSVSPRVANTLAAEIVDWRTPGGMQPLAGTAAADVGSGHASKSPGIPFARLDDLAAVPGMTPDIMQRLRPHLTLFTGADPDLIPASGGADAVNGVRVIGIVAVAHGPGKAMFGRHIIVRTNARRSGRRYEVLMSERAGADAEPNLNAERSSVKP